MLFAASNETPEASNNKGFQEGPVWLGSFSAVVGLCRDSVRMPDQQPFSGLCRVIISSGGAYPLIVYGYPLIVYRHPLVVGWYKHRAYHHPHSRGWLQRGMYRHRHSAFSKSSVLNIISTVLIDINSVLISTNNERVSINNELILSAKGILRWFFKLLPTFSIPARTNQAIIIFSLLNPIHND